MQAFNIETYKINIIISVISLIIVFFLYYFLRKIIEKSNITLNIKDKRKRVFLKLLKLCLFVLFVVTLLVIWKISQKDFYIYLSSILGLLGVGFFAEWSLLSNITSGLILYINHPIGLGDTIKIIDKDIDIEGSIVDIGLFFMEIRTHSGQTVSVPNTTLLEKAFSYIKK